MIAAAILIGFFLVRRLFSLIVLFRLRVLAKKTETVFDDYLLEAVEAPLRFVFVIVGYIVATRTLEFPERFEAINAKVVISLITFTLFWTAYRCVVPFNMILDRMWNVFGAFSDELQGLFVKVAKSLIFVLGLAAILDEWGINVTGFVASLGLVGMAVALAARDFVANLFGGLTIFLDKVFEKGDWIMTPHIEGTVEEIGLRATKIRTFADAIESMPNGALANNEITNWSRMSKRRIRMTIGLEYRTSRDQIEKILTRIRDFIASSEEVVQTGTQLIHMVEFNDSSIDILLYYFTKTTVWAEWMDIRERHMLEFMRIVEEEGAGFAFPSRSLYMENAIQVERAPE
jgi:MscS family membrane protein